MQKLNIREVTVIEGIKHCLTQNESECIYEGILKLECDFPFDLKLLPTTIASLKRKGIISITRDGEGSIIRINKEITGIPEEKINDLNKAFENSKKRELINIFKPESNESKAFIIMFLYGRIYNYQFSSFQPPCLSHTKVISRMRKKLELKSDYTISIAQKDEKSSHKFYWTIIKKGGAR